MKELYRGGGVYCTLLLYARGPRWRKDLYYAGLFLPAVPDITQVLMCSSNINATHSVTANPIIIMIIIIIAYTELRTLFTGYGHDLAFHSPYYYSTYIRTHHRHPCVLTFFQLNFALFSLRPISQLAQIAKCQRMRYYMRPYARRTILYARTRAYGRPSRDREWVGRLKTGV